MMQRPNDAIEELNLPLVKKFYFYDFMNIFTSDISSQFEFKIKFLPEFIPEMVNEKITETDRHYDTLIKDTESKISALSTSSESKLHEINKRIERTEARLERDTITSITTLSIFTGILMAFVGGFQGATQAFSNLTTQNDFKLFFLISLLAFLIFNVLLLFVNLILKVNSHIEIKNGLKGTVIVTEVIIVLSLILFAILHILNTFGLIK